MVNLDINKEISQKYSQGGAGQLLGETYLGTTLLVPKHAGTESLDYVTNEECVGPIYGESKKFICRSKEHVSVEGDTSNRNATWM